MVRRKRAREQAPSEMSARRPPRGMITTHPVSTDPAAVPNIEPLMPPGLYESSTRPLDRAWNATYV